MIDVMASGLERRQRGRIALALSAVVAFGLLRTYGPELPENLRLGLKASIVIGLGVMLRDILFIARRASVSKA